MQLAPKEQEFLPYRVVDTPGCGEYEEKKSRFIAHVYPAQSEEEAMGLIEQTRKKYYDARHNCTAYIIGRNRELKRCSDDGEPGGTAGKPMLEVLLSEGITNVVVIVTRYFGGTLLGTGGLRARLYPGGKGRPCRCRNPHHDLWGMLYLKVLPIRMLERSSICLPMNRLRSGNRVIHRMWSLIFRFQRSVRKRSAGS